jgi:hypothetical protein
MVRTIMAVVTPLVQVNFFETRVTEYQSAGSLQW